jgi:hypothetical protein
MSVTEEHWLVQSSRDGKRWHDEISGPQILYSREDDALRYASQLVNIHKHVRIRNTVLTYRIVK